MKSIMNEMKIDVSVMNYANSSHQCKFESHFIYFGTAKAAFESYCTLHWQKIVYVQERQIMIRYD